MAGTLNFFPALRPLLLLFCLLAWPAWAEAGSSPPYRGHWSNGRGEILVVTADTLRFAGGSAVGYRDLTGATDGHHFELELTARGDVNGFGGKFLAVHCRRDEMRIVNFASHADLRQDRNAVGEVTWFKDSGGENDDKPDARNRKR